ncbi:hypothetical protein E7T09_00965 [Deinococcus sp. KSM4-11]|uniref:hypothetical protein n=1 Tax=Deinococcus sp. KSM4-11 TaxID=2568654 RepID=UPI0010A3BD9E|nr:hypothetical protein [Deinococcus sp. KSM4-11]THF87839.1 hypothetical protein E7T09_00965 [Deinococcus sp. KSM4-11]
MHLRLASLLSLTLLLAACSQSTAPTTTPDPTSSAPSTPVKATGSATLKLFIPAVKASGLGAQFLSAGTTAVRVRIGTVDQTFGVGANAPGCAAVSGGVSCTFSLVVPAGSQTLVIDALDVHGAVLSTSTQQITVTAGANTPLTVTLTGVAAAGSGTLSVTSRLGDLYDYDSYGNGPHQVGLDQGGAYTLAVTLKDASGQVILDPGLPAFRVCSSNPAFTLTGGTTSAPVLTAPEPTNTGDQITTVFIPPDGNCATTTGSLASADYAVSALHSASVAIDYNTYTGIPGSIMHVTGKLFSYLGRPVHASGVRVTADSGGLGSFNPESTVTDANGEAHFLFTTPMSVPRGPYPWYTFALNFEGVVGAPVSYAPKNGPVSLDNSVINLSPDTVNTGQTSTLYVTLQDIYGIEIASEPTVTATGGAVVGELSYDDSDNAYFPITAPNTSGPVTITVASGGVTVKTLTLTVKGNPVTVLDGTQPVPALYDFPSGAAKAFTLQEAGYSGAFTVTANNSNVTASVSGTTLTVTPVSAGTTTLTVSDARGQSMHFDVRVSTLDLVVQ